MRIVKETELRQKERWKMRMKGFTYGYDAKRGALDTEQAIESQVKLMETGMNWVCLPVVAMQEKYNSTDIIYQGKNTVEDEELIRTIHRFRANQIDICLKPMVNCADGYWRAYIDFPDQNMYGEDVYWKKWFESYTGFLLHYARLAEQEQCEMLCIGCEMLGTERKENYWRILIDKIRRVYHGKLVYNSNHGKESAIKWWDMLDYIGTSAYYPVAKYPGDTFENMVKEWMMVANKLEEISRKHKKPMVFIECGCRSATGCAKMPWDFTHKELAMDEEEQENFYNSCLTVLYDKPWFEGVFWWEWSTVVYSKKREAREDRSFNIHMKRAEEVVKHWYAK